MDRIAFDDLKNWMHRHNRKPLVIRGARQVGKTFLIRQFGKSCFKGPRIIPIEVKAGKTGTLKSLQLFLATKGHTTGVRINAAPPTFHTASYALPDMTTKTFDLLSIPFYMIGQLHRLLN